MLYVLGYSLSYLIKLLHSRYLRVWDTLRNDVYESAEKAQVLNETYAEINMKSNHLTLLLRKNLLSYLNKYWSSGTIDWIDFTKCKQI